MLPNFYILFKHAKHRRPSFVVRFYRCQWSKISELFLQERKRQLLIKSLTIRLNRWVVKPMKPQLAFLEEDVLNFQLSAIMQKTLFQDFSKSSGTKSMRLRCWSAEWSSFFIRRSSEGTLCTRFFPNRYDAYIGL